MSLAREIPFLGTNLQSTDIRWLCNR